MSLLFAAVVACEAAPPWPPPRPRREVAPAVLFVRQPDPLAGAGAEPGAAEDGSASRPFSTIAAALRIAPAGALVRVGEGVFQETLVLEKPVVLLGLGPAKTHLSATSGAPGPVVTVQGGARVELRALSLEASAVGLAIAGGGARLHDVALRNLAEGGLLARNAEIAFIGSETVLVGAGAAGVGLQIDGGSLELRGSVLRAAGRRAIVIRRARALVQDVDVSGSGLAAIQAVDGAEVTVEGGRFAQLGGSALYAGGARLAVRRAHISDADYAVVGFRGAELEVRDSEITDTRVAGIGMVRSQGLVDHCVLVRGGTEAAVSITEASGQVRLVGNRILQPGPMGLHVTHATVVATGNTIAGARLDREQDLGDAVYAIDAELSLERNALTGNAGSGVTLTRSHARMLRNDLRGNGRAGLVLLDRSWVNADANAFEDNRGPGVELAERSTATLTGNRFGGNAGYHIDAGCDGAGSVDVRSGNTFRGSAMRQRTCR